MSLLAEPTTYGSPGCSYITELLMQQGNCRQKHEKNKFKTKWHVKPTQETIRILFLNMPHTYKVKSIAYTKAANYYDNLYLPSYRAP